MFQGLDFDHFRSTLRNPCSHWRVNQWFITRFQLVKGFAKIPHFQSDEVIQSQSILKTINKLFFFFISLDTEFGSDSSDWILRGTRVRSLCFFNLKRAQSSSEVCVMLCLLSNHFNPRKHLKHVNVGLGT